VITVVIPTIAGREHWLARCVAAYEASCVDCELIVIPDRGACGIAWQEGAEQASGAFLHFSADDLEPHVGWAEAAVECVESGAIPSPRILNSDGSLQSSGQWGVDLPAGTVTDIARIPFMSRAQWEAIWSVAADSLLHRQLGRRARRSGGYPDGCLPRVRVHAPFRARGPLRRPRWPDDG